MSAVNPMHPMSQLAVENAQKLLACVIWKLRKHCPNLAVEITEKDMEQLADVFMSNGQQGNIAVIGKGDRIVLQLIDSVSGKALIQQHGDENSPNAVMMTKCLAARKRAPVVANRLRHDSNVSTVGKPLAREAAEILELLTWEPGA